MHSRRFPSIVSHVWLPLVTSGACIAFPLPPVNASAAAAPAAPDLSSPDAAVKTLVTAINTKDAAALAACVDGAEADGAFRAAVTAVLQGPETVAFERTRMFLAGEELACVVFDRVVRTRPSDKGEGQMEFLTLVRRGGLWKVDLGPAKAAAAPPEGSVLGLLRTLCYERTAGAAAGEPSSSASSVSAPAEQCLAHGKALAAATLMYLQDHDEQFPPSAAGFHTAVRPYVADPEAFVCPLEKAQPGGGYRFNARLAKRSLASIEEPQRLIVAFEGEQGKLAFRHQGRALVCLATGNAKLVTPAEAAKLRWAP